MTEFDAIARQLIVDLAGTRADVSLETQAVQRAIDGFVANARSGGNDAPLNQLMIPERFAEDEFENHQSVIEMVPGASEDDVFRWRELFCDLCGY